jgi:hypothetical protein
MNVMFTPATTVVAAFAGDQVDVRAWLDDIRRNDDELADERDPWTPSD